MPETKSACQKFKQYLVANLNNISVLGGNAVSVDATDIEEVNSKKHMVLQYMDVIMGMVDFQLNSDEKEKQSKRGQARNYVWKFIATKIYEIHPDFVLDITTKPIFSHRGWLDIYKHFTYQNGKNKAPAIPT